MYTACNLRGYNKFIKDDDTQQEGRKRDKRIRGAPSWTKDYIS